MLHPATGTGTRHFVAWCAPVVWGGRASSPPPLLQHFLPGPAVPSHACLMRLPPRVPGVRRPVHGPLYQAEVRWAVLARALYARRIPYHKTNTEYIQEGDVVFIFVFVPSACGDYVRAIEDGDTHNALQQHTPSAATRRRTAHGFTAWEASLRTYIAFPPVLPVYLHLVVEVVKHGDVGTGLGPPHGTQGSVCFISRLARCGNSTRAAPGARVRAHCPRMGCAKLRTRRTRPSLAHPHAPWR